MPHGSTRNWCQILERDSPKCTLTISLGFLKLAPVLRQSTRKKIQVVHFLIYPLEEKPSLLLSLNVIYSYCVFLVYFIVRNMKEAFLKRIIHVFTIIIEGLTYQIIIKTLSLILCCIFLLPFFKCGEI